jgi:hypothetical protein
MKQKHLQPGRKLAAWLQALMALVYLAAGIYILYPDNAAQLIPVAMMPWTSFALIIYGLFRCYRSWRQLRNPRIKTL